jgi:hypothetical protein
MIMGSKLRQEKYIGGFLRATGVAGNGVKVGKRLGQKIERAVTLVML